MLKKCQAKNPHHPLYFICFVVLMANLLFLVGLAQADSISSHRFSMTFRNQTVSDVFQKLSDNSGFEIHYNDALGNKQVNLHLENATLEKALQKILAHSNYTIIYDRNKTIQIDIYSAGTSSVSRAVRPRARSTPQNTPVISSKRKTHSNQRPVQTPVSGARKRLTADEQYEADERAAGNIP